MAKQPTVSVLCLTYNQAGFIKETLDSFLMQKTDFDIEILVNDDASDDGTKEILESYEKKHSGLISVVYQKVNRYSLGERNFFGRYLMPKAKGKYIALCEGDDYWTDESKLQKQVDFMENNTDCSLCFHPVRVVYESGKEKDDTFPKLTGGFTVDELLQGNFIQTNSVMYRRQDYKSMSFDLSPADWYLHLYHAQFGNIGFINEQMAVYRRHEAGIWNDSGKTNTFWAKQAIGHLSLYEALLEIYGSVESRREIIDSKIVDGMRGIRKLPGDESPRIIKEIVAKHPNLAQTIIEEFDLSLLKSRRANAETVNDLKDARSRLSQQLTNIKSSRTWRLRNRIAKILGKPVV